MKATWKLFTAILLSMLLAIGSSCKKDDPENNGNDIGGGSNNTTSDVRVTTYTPHDITATSAVCGGEVIESSGIVSVLGVCWNTSSNPTVDGFHSSTPNWNEPHICTLTGLEPDTKYYVRAYAISGMECYYGVEMEFTTASVGLPPTISVYQGSGYIKDGDILDLDTEYQFGFEVSSDKGLAFLSVEIDGYDWTNVDLQGLTSYTFTDVITYEMASKDEIIGESTINAVVTDVDGLMNSASIHVLINQPAHQLENIDFEWVKQGNNVISADEMAAYGLMWGQTYKEIFVTLKPIEGAILYVCNGDGFENITTDVERAAYFVNLMETSSPVGSYRNISAMMASQDYNDMLALIGPNGEPHLIHIMHTEIQTSSSGSRITITGEIK